MELPDVTVDHHPGILDTPFTTQWVMTIPLMDSRSTLGDKDQKTWHECTRGTDSEKNYLITKILFVC